MRLYKYIQKDILQENLQYQDLVEYNTGSAGHPVYPSKKSIIRNYLDAMDFYVPNDDSYECRYRILTKIINKYYNYELFTDNYEYFGNRMLWRLNKIMPTYRAKFNSMLAQNGYEDIWDDGLLWEHREGTRDTKRPEKDTDNHPVNFDRTDLADTTTTVGYNSDYPQVIVGSSTDYNATGDKTTTGRSGNDTVTHAMQENVGYGEDITRKFSPEEIAKAKLLFAQLIFNIDEEIVNAVADLFVLVDYPFEDDFDVAIQMSILDDAKAYTNLKFNESKAYTDQEVAKAKEIVYIPYDSSTPHSEIYDAIVDAVSNGKLPILKDTYNDKLWYLMDFTSGVYEFANGIDWVKYDYSTTTTGTFVPPQAVEVIHTSNTSYTFFDLALLSNTKLLFVEDDAGISGDYHTIFAYQSLNINEIVFSNVYQDSGTHYIRSLRFTFNIMEWTYEYYELQEKLIGLDGYVGQNIKEINGETILGTGSIDTKELFKCTYGTTTYADVVQALQNGKIPVILDYNKKTYIFQRYDGTMPNPSYIRFFSIYSNRIDYTILAPSGSNNGWSSSASSLQLANLVTSWQATPDDTHYPSEKLVKDTIDTIDKFVECTYGTTTAGEITNILNNGKIPYVIYQDRIYIYTNGNGNVYYFGCLYANILRSVYISKTPSTNTSWSYYTYTVESTNYKVSSWSATPNDTRYPSEKLVKDSIDAIIAGQTYATFLIDLSQQSYSSGVWTISGVDLTSYSSFTILPYEKENPNWTSFLADNMYIDSSSITASGFQMYSGNSFQGKLRIVAYI